MSTTADKLSGGHRTAVLNARGISDEVIDAVSDRYQSFERGDWERFFELMRFPRTMPRKKQAAWRGKVRQTGGLVVKRWGHDATTPPPYGRLDVPVYMRPTRKTHYVYRGGHRTQYIDVHPLAVPKIAAGRPIYFCLEGCFKADAVLSQGAAVISSTSVSTWQNKDLTRMLPILREAPRVFIVPDSDYFSSDKGNRSGSFNEWVVLHTRHAAQWLAGKGVDVVIAVPWLGGSNKTGADDFLAAGHCLGELTQTPVFFDTGIFSDSLTSKERRVAAYLTRTQGEWGAFYPSDVAKAVDCDRKTVWRTTSKLERLGIMEVWEGKPHERDDGTYVNGPNGYRAFRLNPKVRVSVFTPPRPPNVRRETAA